MTATSCPKCGCTTLWRSQPIIFGDQQWVYDQCARCGQIWVVDE